MIQRVEAGRELTQSALGDLGGALPDLISKGVTVIALDISRVTEFDSQTLEGLLEFDALARSRGLTVQILVPSEAMAWALHVTGLWDRLEIEQVESALLAALGRAPAVMPAPAGVDA